MVLNCVQAIKVGWQFEYLYIRMATTHWFERASGLNFLSLRRQSSVPGRTRADRPFPQESLHWILPTIEPLNIV